MKIFKLLNVTLAILFFSSDLLSNNTFYGKINVSYENAKKSSVQDTGFENNASRIGVKGKFKLLEGINFRIRSKEKRCFGIK